MASESIEVPVGSGTWTLLVVFPYDHSDTPDAKIKSDLDIIQKWFTTFNNNGGDIRGRLPRTTQLYPAATLIVTGLLHRSTFSPNEPPHITSLISTASQWNRNPREHRACIHIYGETDGTYNAWFLHSRGLSRMNSVPLRDGLAAALTNNRGTLGQGALV